MEMRADFNKHCTEDLGTQHFSLVSWWSGGALLKLGGRDLGKYEVLSLSVLSSQGREEKSWFLCSSDLPLCKQLISLNNPDSTGKKTTDKHIIQLASRFHINSVLAHEIACHLSISPRDSRIQLPFLKPEMRH